VADFLFPFFGACAQAIQRSASEAVPRKAAAVEALQKELHEAKEAQRIFMEQSYGNDRDPEVMAAFEEMMDAIEAAQREMNEAAFAEQDKAAYDLWEALMT
jgi:Asp-tRNA(Asn)/Glu-tRNA(Gln) amidotransferase A subunit family amidase